MPRNRRTIIRADERLQPLVGGLFGGIVGGVGGGVGGGAAMPLAIAIMHSAAAGVGFFGATVVGAYVLARTLYVWIRGKRERDLSNLLDELGEHITHAEG